MSEARYDRLCSCRFIDHRGRVCVCVDLVDPASEPRPCLRCKAGFHTLVERPTEQRLP